METNLHSWPGLFSIRGNYGSPSRSMGYNGRRNNTGECKVAAEAIFCNWQSGGCYNGYGGFQSNAGIIAHARLLRSVLKISLLSSVGRHLAISTWPTFKGPRNNQKQNAILKTEPWTNLLNHENQLFFQKNRRISVLSRGYKWVNRGIGALCPVIIWVGTIINPMLINVDSCYRIGVIFLHSKLKGNFYISVRIEENYANSPVRDFQPIRI